MGKNLDTDNIFGSYMNNVLLKEEVKSTEGGDGNLNKEIETLKVLLTNPNLSQEDKSKAQASLDQMMKSNPPAGTMTVDQAKQLINQQQAQNAAPSQGTVVSKSSSDVSTSATNQTSKTPPRPKTRGEAAALRERGQLQAQPNLEAEYNKKLGRTPGFYDADNFRNVDAVGNEKRFPDMAAYKKQLQTGQVPAQAAPPTASVTPQVQQSGVSLTDPNSISLGGGSSSPQTASGASANLTDPNSVSLGGQPAKPADDFQKKLDTSFAEFQKKNASATQPATPQKAQSSGGGSVVDYLAGQGQATDRGSRAKLAAQYGIQGYSGTAEQNTQLLSKLKSGEKPATQQAATQPKAKQQGMGGVVGAVSKGIGSVGQGIKQTTVGTKKPLGGILGGISKGIGSAGKGIKKALVGDQSESEENAEDKFVQFEKNNIAKFLKFLSEKNYSQAHNYLKKIVNNKVEKNLYKVINKN